MHTRQENPISQIITQCRASDDAVIFFIAARQTLGFSWRNIRMRARAYYHRYNPPLDECKTVRGCGMNRKKTPVYNALLYLLFQQESSLLKTLFSFFLSSACSAELEKRYRLYRPLFLLVRLDDASSICILIINIPFRWTNTPSIVCVTHLWLLIYRFKSGAVKISWRESLAKIREKIVWNEFSLLCSVCHHTAAGLDESTFCSTREYNVLAHLYNFLVKLSECVCD